MQDIDIRMYGTGHPNSVKLLHDGVWGALIHVWFGQHAIFNSDYDRSLTSLAWSQRPIHILRCL